MKEKDRKNLMIVFLLGAVVFMTVGFALLSAKLEQKDSMLDKDAKWDIKIESISSTSVTGNAESVNFEIVNSFISKFTSKFLEPEDKISYTINIKNDGTIDAKLNSLTILPTSSNNNLITYTVEDLSAGDILKVGETKTFLLVASYNREDNSEEEQEEIEDEAILILDYIQSN